MKKSMLFIAIAILALTAGCTKDIENVTVGEIKDKVVEQSQAVLEAVKALTAAVSEEEFKPRETSIQIVAKRGLELANVNYDIASGSLSYTVDGTQY